MKAFPLIAGFVLFMLGVYVGGQLALLHAQEAVSPSSGMIRAVITTTGNVPTYADDPGAEGEVEMDATRIYTFHGGAWGWSPRFALPASALANTTPDTLTP